MNKTGDLNTVPMSEGDADVTQTMIQEGMLQAPAHPGARGAVGRFEILRPLATGGMGQVFLAREPVTDGRVAIKMIRPRYRREEWVVRRFLAEAQHMYRMSHPNILKVMEVADRKEGPYYVMPFVEGGSLAQAIKPGRPLPEDRVLEIARQIADALQYAHARGIIHRDLKPANVLLDPEGRAYLTDFGLLRTVFNDALVDPDKSAPEGTAAYMSPLAASGKAEDTRCDIYAFGAVLYEMLTGDKPYEGINPKAIVDQILAGPPRPILQVNPKAPPALGRIAEWCMARELRDRYAEMADVARDLDRVAREEVPLGPHGRDHAVKATPFKYRALAAGLGLLIGVGAVVLASRLKKPPAATPHAALSLSAKELCVRGWAKFNEQGPAAFTEAEKLFLQATEADPGLADAWNGLGWSRQNLGMPQNAREAFARCVALDPKNAGALNGLGWIAKIEGKPAEAVSYWERAVAAMPQASAALAGLASTHLEMGHHDLAIKHAGSWLALEPGNAEARRILAEAESKRKEQSTNAAEEPPRILGTTPAVGATDVDPSASEITVTFDQDMAGGFSWTGGGPDYPPATGGPFWRDARTCVLPVKLEPGRYYRVGINSKSHRNFRGKAGVPAPPSAIYFTTQGASDELKARTQKPVVLEMSPANGAENVDPATAELRVTFSVPMGGGFSWTGGGPEYPPGVEGKGPYWTADRRTCALPVKLDPNHAYRVGLNSFSHKNFQSAAGVPLEPVVYTFQTGPAGSGQR